MSVRHDHVRCKNVWTDRYTVQSVDTSGPYYRVRRYLRDGMLSSFYRTSTCDRQTDRQTDRETRGHSIYRASTASRSQNV